jgi:tripartite-type tricarboxylate transporter receptor subunit TctC
VFLSKCSEADFEGFHAAPSALLSVLGQNKKEVIMSKKMSVLFITMAAIMLYCSTVSAAAPFFEGKTIRIIVGLSAGGGYDLYARTMARHMNKYIPGKPTIIVENMPGGGTMIAANYVYNVAKPDGLTIGHFAGALFTNQVLKQPGIQFDSLKYEYLGAPLKDDVACALSKTTGITTIQQWMESKRPIKMAGSAPGASPDSGARMAQKILGLPVQVVSGYKSVPEMRLAVENGEADGVCFAWTSMRSTWRDAIQTGRVVVILQAMSQPAPDLPKIPNAISLAKTDEARKLIDVGMHKNAEVARPFVLPPGTPKDRVQILQKAFMDTMKDKEFLAEAEKAKLDIDPLSGQELREAVAALFKMDPNTVKKMEEVYYK